MNDDYEKTQSDSSKIPSTRELKSRFKSGSVPRENDFANLIDVAEYGRKATGQHPEQTPDPNSGLILNDQQQLTLHVDKNKGLTTGEAGLALVVNPDKALTVDDKGIGVATGNGIVAVNNKLNIVLAKGDYNNGGGGENYDGTTTGAAGGLIINSKGLSVDAGKGMQINQYGISIKHPANKGLHTDETQGLSIVLDDAGGLKFSNNGIGINTGRGLKNVESQLNVKLAKGSQNNGGGGQGNDGATDGSAGGLNLSDNGLAVHAGSGIKIDAQGVSVKYPENQGLRADKENGLSIVINTSKGMMADNNGISINTGNGLMAGSNKLSVRLAKGAHHNGGNGQGADGTTAGAAGGLILDANGLSVDAGRGIQIEAAGVSIKCAVNGGLIATETGGLSLTNNVGWTPIALEDNFKGEAYFRSVLNIISVSFRVNKDSGRFGEGVGFKLPAAVCPLERVYGTGTIWDIGEESLHNSAIHFFTISKEGEVYLFNVQPKKYISGTICFPSL